MLDVGIVGIDNLGSVGGRASSLEKMSENGPIVAEILQIQVFTTCIIGVTGNKPDMAR
jgi:hypothetical protein